MLASEITMPEALIGGRQLYCATTSPTEKASSDRLEANDVLNDVPEGIMDSFASFVFIPICGIMLDAAGFPFSRNLVAAEGSSGKKRTVFSSSVHCCCRDLLCYEDSFLAF